MMNFSLFSFFALSLVSHAAFSMDHSNALLTDFCPAPSFFVSHLQSDNLALKSVSSESLQKEGSLLIPSRPGFQLIAYYDPRFKLQVDFEWSTHHQRTCLSHVYVKRLIQPIIYASSSYLHQCQPAIIDHEKKHHQDALKSYQMDFDSWQKTNPFEFKHSNSLDQSQWIDLVSRHLQNWVDIMDQNYELTRYSVDTPEEYRRLSKECSF